MDTKVYGIVFGRFFVNYRKKASRFLAMLLTITLLVTAIPMNVLIASAATTQFAGGSGTATDPYLIETKVHLNNVRNDLDAHYKMIANIVFTASDDWIPIGNSKKDAFCGNFDGNNYDVIGLKISSDSYAGLFGYMNGGVIQNLGMVDSDISTYDSTTSYANISTYAGGIVGYVNEGDIINCYNTGKVSASSSSRGNYSGTYANAYAYAGGIAGYSKGSIIDCYNTGSVNGTVESNAKATYYNVSADSYVGGIVGAGNGNLTKCFNKGDITAFTRTSGTSPSQYDYEKSYAYTNTYVGGIAGSAGSITNCYNTGGIFASAWSLPNSRSFSSTSEVYAGGIVGSAGIITNCYNTGEIKTESEASARDTEKKVFPNTANAYSYAGGVVGNAGTITTCYNTGSITTSATAYVDSYSRAYKYNYSGGIAGGGHDRTVNIINSYYLNNIDNGVGDDTDYAISCELEQMKTQSTYVGFDFDAVWYSVDYSTPVLRGLRAEIGDRINFAGGTGTVTNPYKVATKEHLNNVRNDLAANYILITDIEFNEDDFEEGGAFYNSGNGWNPIGSYDTPFSGEFNGNGYSIIGLTIDAETTDDDTYIGLFGCLNGGIIKNLGMVDIAIKVQSKDVHYSCVGGIVGYVIGGTITDCYHIGSISITNDNAYTCAGGIAGYVTSGSITDCYNLGSVMSLSKATYSCAGGIVGYAKTRNSDTIIVEKCYNKGCINAIITTKGSYECANSGGVVGEAGAYGDLITVAMCYNTGTISATASVLSDSVDSNSNVYAQAGGIAGDAYQGRITDCYNIGNINAMADSEDDADGTAAWGAGIAGGGSHATISRCYNKGSISGVAKSSVYVCGIVGYAYSATVANCYYLNNTTKGVGTGTDTTIVCTLAQMKVQNLYTSFDFDAVWTMGGNADYHYPELQSVVMDYEKTLQSIVLTEQPSKLLFVEGMELDVSGGLITVSYDNDTTEVVAITKDMVSGFDNTMVGKQTLTITYGGKTATYEVEVITRSLISIAITTLPTKLKYLEGMHTLSVTGGQITIFYDGGVTEIKDITLDMVSGFDNTKVGKQTLTIDFEDKTAVYDIEVIAKSVTSVVVTTSPDKLSYLEYMDALDVTGGQITISYDGGFSEVKDITLDMVSGFNNTIVGKQTLNVVFEGKAATYEVEIVPKSLASIAVTIKPSKLIYLEGDSFDKTGMVVTAYYNNNTSAIVTDYTISGYDSTPGSKNIIVTHDGETASFTVSVHAKSLTHITVTMKPSKLIYLEGDSFDKAGMVVTAYYNNNTSAIVTDYTIGGYDSTPGSKTVTVAYGGKNTTFMVEVTAKSLTRIEVTQTPTKTTFIEGKDELTVNGGQITLYYNNGTSQTMDMIPSMITGFDNSIVGFQTLTVNYNNKTATYEIEIIAKSLETIELIDNGLKKEYLEGKDTLDVKNGVVRCHYNNDTYSDIDLSESMITGFNNNVIGIQTITITYNDKTTTYDVEIIAKSLVSIELIDNGLKKEYLEGKDMLDVTGGIVRRYYNNDTYSDIVLSAEMVSGFDNGIVGTQQLTVTYGKCSDVYNIVIIEKSLQSIAVTTLPDKTHYLVEKDAFVATGGKVTLYYNNGTTETIDLTNSMISGFSNQTVGTNTITVTYEGKTAIFNVTIDEKILTSIVVTKQPAKLTYLEGDAFDKTGMVVTAYYNNNTCAIVADYAVSGYTSTPGNKTITVTYQGKTASFIVEVDAKSLTSIVVTAKPNKLTYLEGDSFDKTGMIVTAYYNNNTSAVVTDYTISGYTSTPGSKTVTVTYGGKTATFTVEVVAKSLTSIAVITLPDKTHYLVEKDIFDATGGKVMLYYNNDTTEIIDLTNSMVSGFSNLTAGTNTLTVSYEGKTTTFNVTIDEKTLTDIAVTIKPTKLTYREGDEFDKSGMEVVAYYNNGTSEIVLEYTVSGDLSTKGIQTITVSYGGKTTTFTVEVLATGEWKFDGIGWWYLNSNGTYPANCWKEIDNVWYYFNASGYILTGWQSIGGTWYYFNGSGAMLTGWQSIGGTWYYFMGSGAMVTGWQLIDDTWYYFAGSGAMMSGWQAIGGTWYYFAGSGAMATGWQSIGGTWYYFNGSGAMLTGWQLIDGAWYYLEGSGAMVTNRWVGNYYLQADGTMATNKWIGSYYVGEDGVWVP